LGVPKRELGNERKRRGGREEVEDEDVDEDVDD